MVTNTHCGTKEQNGERVPPVERAVELGEWQAHTRVCISRNDPANCLVQVDRL